MLAALIPMIGTAISQVLDRTLPGEDAETKKLKIQLQADMQKALMSIDMAQLEINKIEAANPNRSWPTWRECLGYICVVAVLYRFVILDFISVVLSAAGHQVTLPEFEISGLMTILSAMLGVHFVDSRFNSPAGQMPTPQRIQVAPPRKDSSRTPYVQGKGKLVDGIWQPD